MFLGGVLFVPPSRAGHKARRTRNFAHLPHVVAMGSYMLSSGASPPWVHSRWGSPNFVHHLARHSSTLHASSAIGHIIVREVVCSHASRWCSRDE